MQSLVYDDKSYINNDNIGKANKKKNHKNLKIYKEYVKMDN